MSKYDYAGLDHTPLFLINGQVPPGNVKYGYTEDTEQLVKSQRNSEGVVVATKVGNRLLKFNNLEWAYLEREDYEWLQRQIADFYCKVTYYDARRGGVVERKFYWGDFSAEPFKFDRNDVSRFINTIVIYKCKSKFNRLWRSITPQSIKRKEIVCQV